jgi:dTDP-3-amino-2,3,6-trideoxy-4-keto-D-glucose/dTDP-3-amino-3,4,6-trideoxy-alpha-D-glucose/dTDP-2,6-dideoxy-D-kanosamine transaminase
VIKRRREGGGLDEVSPLVSDMARVYNAQMRDGASFLGINDLKRHHASLHAQLSRVAAEVLTSGWFVLGPRVEAFERAFADFCGTTHAVGVANGTDALELALRALDVGPGDEVITVANAGMYTTVAILAIGATPVFVEVDAAAMTLDPSLLERAIGPRCKALVLTHLYGRLADVEGVLAIAAAQGIAVVEDCAQSHGAALGDRLAGSFGTLGCFSFYPTKNLGACGDGGAIITSNAELALRLRGLRQYGWSDKYAATRVGGRNSRLDELQAALLLAKLPHLPDWNARRVAIATRFSSEIRHPLIEVPTIEAGSNVAHLYVVKSTQRDALRLHLREHGLATDVHYPIPDHRQQALFERYGHVRLPVTEQLAQEVLTLPCFPEMTDREVTQVIAACNAWEP